jgi:single-stranded DNA-binding protein
MAPTSIELSGRVLDPPGIGVTPNGRDVLRLSVDCGEAPERLVLEVVMVDGAARDLARSLTAGRRIRASGKLRARSREVLGGAGRQQIEVIANEIVPEQASGDAAGRP